MRDALRTRLQALHIFANPRPLIAGLAIADLNTAHGTSLQKIEMFGGLTAKKLNQRSSKAFSPPETRAFVCTNKDGGHRQVLYCNGPVHPKK